MALVEHADSQEVRRYASDAVTAAASATPPVLQPGLYIVGADLLVQGDLTLAPGAVLDIRGGVTLTVSGNLSAPATAQVVAGDGSLRLPGQRVPVHAEWFGARADQPIDSAPAFQRATDALVNGGTVQALAGSYRVGCETSDAVRIRGKAPVNVYGAGSQTTIFRPITNCSHAILSIEAENQSGNLRDFAILGDQLGLGDPTDYRVDGIVCRQCGVSDIQNLSIGAVRNPLRLDFILDAKVANLYLQSYSGTGISVGGGPLNANGKQVASIVQFQDVIAFPSRGLGYGMDIDSGANEISVYRLVTAGGQEGVRIRNTSPGGHFAEGIRFFAANIDAFLKGNVNVYEGHMIEFHNGSIGTTLIPGLPPNANASVNLNGAQPHLVEGIWINDTTVRGAGGSGILVRNACNVRLSGVMSYANGQDPGPTMAAGIEVAGGCGTIDIVDAHAGLDAGGNAGWGNALGRQAYGIALSPGITPRTYTAGDRAFTTRVKITGCMCAGNLVTGILDRSSVAPSWKLFANNMLN